MLFASGLLSLALTLSGPAAAAGGCQLQGTQWLQDGALLGALDGPGVARALFSPELVAVEVEMTPGASAAFVKITDSVARVEAFMPYEQLRVQMTRPMAFADDTIYIGSADLKVMAVEDGGVRVAPMDLPDWIKPDSALSSPVGCGDLDLVNAWRGDMRVLAVGSAPRGKRVYLRAGEMIQVSRISGSSSAVELWPSSAVPVEEIKRSAGFVRILLRFPGGLVVGWVAEEYLSEQGGGSSEDPAAEAETAAVDHGSAVVCSKEMPLWVTAGGQDFMLGVLSAGASAVLGEKQDDRVPVLAVPDATSWTTVEGAQWWLDAKSARKCK